VPGGLISVLTRPPDEPTGHYTSDRPSALLPVDPARGAV